MVVADVFITTVFMSSLGPSSWKSRFSCHKREGCQLVKQALECEENDNGSDYDPNLVVTMYRMGVQVISCNFNPVVRALLADQPSWVNTCVKDRVVHVKPMLDPT